MGKEHDLTLESIEKIYIEAQDYTTIHSNEFNRLWANANRTTRDIRAIIDEMLLNHGNSFDDVLASKDALMGVKKPKAVARQPIYKLITKILQNNLL